MRRHPSQWRWCGYEELSGKRLRYCIIDSERLLETMEFNSTEEFQTVYENLIKMKIESDELKREACWTESLAVGSQKFIQKAQMLYPQRHFLYPEMAGLNGSDAWCVKEDDLC